jgi:hypothetical protein
MFHPTGLVGENERRKMNEVYPNTSFLKDLDQSMNAWTQHRFLDAIQKSEPRPTAPAEVVERVKHNLLTPSDEAKAQQLRARLDQFPDDALALAAHILRQQAKTPEQRKAEKAAKADFHRRACLLEKPPTDRQIAALHGLGYEEPIGSRQEAMDLLSQRIGPGKAA